MSLLGKQQQNLRRQRNGTNTYKNQIFSNFE
jgi:hypothetical protein